MFGLPFFSKNKLKLAFEYGLILAEVAKEQGVEVTPEMSKRAEVMIENEFKKDEMTIALEMTPNILSVFETDMDKPTSSILHQSEVL